MLSKKLALKLAENESKNFPCIKTIICKSCKGFLWEVKIIGKNSAGWKKKVRAYEGVPPYSEAWIDNQPQFLECPHCGKQYFDAVQGAPGQLIPIIKTLEDDF